MQTTRRHFIQLLGVGATSALAWRSWAAPPRDNPLAALNLAWTAKLPWDRVLDITTLPGEGEFWDARLEAAQARLAPQGGGVIFFPAGEYRFASDIRLRSGIVLRGAPPEGATRAHEEKFAPPARLEFPRYQPVFTGSGTPIATAFKGIVLEDPATAANCGVVHLSINRGYINLAEAENHRCGGQRLVFGCLIRNAAGVEPGIPVADGSQPGWLRYTAKFRSAIRVHAAENALVANNRIPKSGDDNFLMEEYPLLDRQKKVVRFAVLFDYDNRPGIYVNHHCIGGAGGSGNDGTPESHPWGFRQGSVICDNYVYNTGRCAIGFSGDGVLCARNVIRFARDEFRPTVTGIHASYGSATNDNRALEMRGWRWVVEGNDYEVYSNWCSDKKYRINDGEGLMHEDHCNSIIRDSRLVNNRGNSYLSLFHVGAVEGLHIEGNDISTPGNIADIYVTAPRHKQAGEFPARRVVIVNNITRANGIRLMGAPAAENVIKGNRHLGPKPGVILNQANAVVEGNENYEVKSQAGAAG
ncbi:MAG: glycoside hydrolase family 55 protein [Verrucomicrobiae bacterium]|nr:glycoside hydrolase family 55 protein [Verrucomicrobiae bacterium]